MLAELVARHLDAGDRAVREVPSIELLLPPGGPRVVEVQGGDGPPQGILLLGDGSSWHLNAPDGADAFLSRVAPGLDPLAVVLTLLRYRIPELVGARSARLATREDDLDPSLARAGVPLGLEVNGDRIVFTGAYGGERAGADRWTAVTGAEPSLTREALAP
jgi:hypothetical protein